MPRQTSQSSATFISAATVVAVLLILGVLCRSLCVLLRPAGNASGVAETFAADADAAAHGVLPAATAGVLRNAFGDQRCSLLSSPALTGNARLTARQYIDSNRLRVWKPADASHGSSSATTTACYVNFDARNGTKDHLLAGATCSKDDAVFKSAAFIKRAFVDDMPEATNDATVKKCVVEVDPAQVTPAALQDFWTNAGSSECVRLNQSILDAHEELKQRLAETNQTLDALTARSQAAGQTLAAQAARAQQLRTSLASMAKQQQEMTQQLQTAQAQAKASVDKRKEVEEACTMTLQAMKLAYDKCTLQLSTTRANHASLQDRHTTAIATLSEVSSQLAANKQMYQSLSKQVASMNQDRSSLQQQYESTTTTLATTEQQRRQCEGQRDECTSAVQDYQQVLPGVLQEKDACAAKLQECTSYKDSILQQAATQTGLNNQSQQALDGTNQELRRCLATNALLAARITGQNLDIDELQKRSDKMVCAQYDPIIADLRARQQDLASKCGSVEASSATQNATSMGLVNSQVSKLQGMVYACSL